MEEGRVSWKRLQHGLNDGGRDDEEKINWGCSGFSFFFYWEVGL